MTWPLDVFWAAWADVGRMRREDRGGKPDPGEAARDRAKQAKERARWGLSGPWW